MKIQFIKCSAIIIVMFVGSSVFSQDCGDYYTLCDSDVSAVSYLGGGDSCQKDCDDDCGKGSCYSLGDCCGGEGGAFVDLEALFFRVNHGRSGTNPGTPEFDHEFAPRISVGYVGCGGLGIRFRYFDYKENAENGTLGAPNSRFMEADTYNLDLELFSDVEIGCATSLEWSAGVRYNDFRFRDVTLAANPAVIATGNQTKFNGWGVMFGLQANHQVGFGRFYGRARWAMLQDEVSTRTTNLSGPVAAPVGFITPWIDDLRIVTEVAIGYEVSRCTNYGVLTGRIGYEMQLWDSYLQFIGGRNDFAFDGLVLGLELAR